MTNYPIDDAMSASEDLITITLLNKIMGTTYSNAPVYGSNTMEQVLTEYATDLGINPKDTKIIFENKRTGESTCDLSETIKGLSLQDHDVLAICDNAGVA